MIQTDFPTGDTGTIRLKDFTDENNHNKTVEIWIRSLSPVAARIYWSHEIDGVSSWLASSQLQSTTLWQKVEVVYVGLAEHFVFRLLSSNTTQLGGPTPCEIDLTAGVGKVMIKVGNVYKKAVPYVKVNGVWTEATAWVMSNGQWVET